MRIFFLKNEPQDEDLFTYARGSLVRTYSAKWKIRFKLQMASAGNVAFGFIVIELNLYYELITIVGE